MAVSKTDTELLDLINKTSCTVSDNLLGTKQIGWMEQQEINLGIGKPSESVPNSNTEDDSLITKDTFVNKWEVNCGKDDGYTDDSGTCDVTASGQKTLDADKFCKLSSNAIHHDVKEGEANVVSSNTDHVLSNISGDGNSGDKKLTGNIDIGQSDKGKTIETVNNLTDENISSLTKDELIERIKSCRQELDSLRKQLKKSERQVKRADDYNEVLRSMLEKVSSQIHSYKNGTYKDTGVQVDKVDLANYVIGEPCMPDWGTNTIKVENESSKYLVKETMEIKGSDETSLSLADSIKLAAQDILDQQTQDSMQQQGYIYDETYRLYYHAQSGYYYDWDVYIYKKMLIPLKALTFLSKGNFCELYYQLPDFDCRRVAIVQEKMLYYDPNSGTYYYFDYDSGQYAFHSQVTVEDGSSVCNKTTSQQCSMEKSETPGRSTYSREKKGERTKSSKERDGTAIQGFKNRRERRQAVREIKDRANIRKKKQRRQNDRTSHKKQRDTDKVQKRNERGSSSGDCRRGKSCERNSGERNHKADHPKPKYNDESDKDNTKPSKRQNKKSDKEKAGKKKHNNSTYGQGKHKNVYRDLDISYLPYIDYVGVEMKGFVDVSDDDMISIGSDGEITEITSMETDTVVQGDEQIDSKTDIVLTHVPDENENMNQIKSDRLSKKAKKSSFDKMQIDSSGDSYSSESESGELSSTEESKVSTESEDDTYIVHDFEDEDLGDKVEDITPDITQTWPPCVRVIVTESDCVAVGMLYIITFQGTSIGRGKDNGICIPDINISKCHAAVKFNETDGVFTITDKGSQNGTFINGERISKSKESSEEMVFNHGDKLEIGGTKLMCHIHTGTDTCDECEPGIVMAKFREQIPKQEVKFLSKEERKKLQKKELNQIKKRYGLKNSAYESHTIVSNNPNYEDKAAERRKIVGSEMPHVKQETPASLYKPITSENKGHKLLEKMGWKEGESLGKNNSGIQEPIPVFFRLNQSAGLGSTGAGLFFPDDANSMDAKKAGRRIQALQRYRELEKADEVTKLTDKSSLKTDEPILEMKPPNKYKMVWTKGDNEFN